MKNITIKILIVLTIAFIGLNKVDAGTLFPSSAPGTSMYSLQDLYNLVVNSATTTAGNGSVIYVPSSVGNTMVTMSDLYNAILTLKNASSTDGGNVDMGTRQEYGELKIRTSLDNPSSSRLKVEENRPSDQHTLFAFNLWAKESNIDIQKVQIKIKTQSANVSDVISDLTLEIDGQDFDNWSFISGSTSTEAVVEFNINNGHTIAIDNTVPVHLKAVFKAVNGINYSSGEKISSSIENGAVTGVDLNEVISVDSVEGNLHTLDISGVTIEDYKWVVNNTGNIVDFFFTVTAEDEDFDVLSSSIASTTAGTATTSAGVLTKSTGDADTISGGFRVLDGDTATFRVRYTLTGSNGAYKEITITSVAGQEIPDSEQVSPTATININN